MFDSTPFAVDLILSAITVGIGFTNLLCGDIY